MATEEQFKRQYIVSERAHYMCPNMCFGFKVKLKAGFSGEKMDGAIEALAAAHPFLQSVIAEEAETGRLYYEFKGEMPLKYIVGADSVGWEDDYKELTANGWNAREESLLKIVVYPCVDGLTAMFVAHHLLTDGRGLLGLAREFVDCYVRGAKPSRVEEQLLTSIHDLPAGSDLPLISRIIINRANRAFAKENRAVSYPEYLEFEKKFIRENPLDFAEETVSAEDLGKLREKCRSKGISLNDYLVAEMMCREGRDKVVIAADIRSKVKCYRQGALGNYASAMGIESKAPADDVFAKAQDVGKQIKNHLGNNKKLMLVLACYFRMSPQLIDAVAISTLGDYPSKAGNFIGSAMFGFKKREGYSVTNLGNIDDPDIIEAVFIPPASPANAKTMGVVSANGRMKKCSAIYQPRERG